MSKAPLTYRCSLGFVAFFFGMICSRGSAQSPWQFFRGPDGSGVASSDSVIMELEPKKNTRWRTAIAEAGWSTPITDGKRLWMTSALTTKGSDEQRAAKLADAKFAEVKDVVGSVTLFAYCLDIETGRIVHRLELARIESPGPINFMNSYASPTGVWVGDRVVLHFGRYGTWCLNSDTGTTIWKKTLEFDDSVGPGSSLKHHDGVILVTCDGIDIQFISGLSLETGEEVWRTARPPMDAEHGEFKKAYSTPLIIETAGRFQAVILGAQWCAAYDPKTGKELWRLRHSKGFSVSPTPIFVDGKVIIATGYGGNVLVAIDPTGHGDVTESHVVWRQSKGMPLMPSPIVVNGLLYCLADGGILSALRLKDGSLVWQKRLGGKYSSSPFASGDRIMIGDHEGKVTILRAGDEYQEIATYDLGEQIMACPVPIGDDLIVRTKEAVYRFSKK